jgi:hypothetical protein
MAEEKGTRIDRLEEKDWSGLNGKEWKGVSEVLHGHSPSARLRRGLQARQSVTGAPSLAGVQSELRAWLKKLR